MEAILLIGPLERAWLNSSDGVDEWKGLHVHDVLDLLSPIPNAELAFLELLRHLLLLIWICLCEVLHVLHETLHVAHAEKLGDERLRRELVEVMQVLADTEEDYGSTSRGHTDENMSILQTELPVTDSRRDCSTTLSMTIHLCHNDGTKICALLECLTLCFCRLT